MIKNFELLSKNIDELNIFISKESGKKEKLLEQSKAFEMEILEINKNMELLEKVCILLQNTSEFARKQGKSQIENLVTKCLQYIFESNIKFTIEIEELRNKANAQFYVISENDGMEIKTRPELSRGGGVVDIVSLALRIAFLQIHKPRIEGPLILDEPAKHVSEDYIYNVGDFLKETSEMFNRQIIMVTHNQHLSALSNNSYRIDIEGSTSIATKVES